MLHLAPIIDEWELSLCHSQPWWDPARLLVDICGNLGCPEGGQGTDGLCVVGWGMGAPRMIPCTRQERSLLAGEGAFLWVQNDLHVSLGSLKLQREDAYLSSTRPRTCGKGNHTVNCNFQNSVACYPFGDEVSFPEGSTMLLFSRGLSSSPFSDRLYLLLIILPFQ